MTDETERQLREARSLLKRCADKISSRKTNTNRLSDVDREMLIGFGTAHDWITNGLSPFVICNFSDAKNGRSEKPALLSG